MFPLRVFKGVVLVKTLFCPFWFFLATRESQAKSKRAHPVGSFTAFVAVLVGAGCVG